MLPILVLSVVTLYSLGWYLLTILCLSIATATMITSFNLQSGTRYILLTWTRPNLLPIHYKASAICNYICNVERNIHNTKTILATYEEAIFKYIPPWSTCDITFTAVYNPASLDPGIHQLISTQSERKSCFNTTIGSGYYYQLLFSNILNAYFFSMLRWLCTLWITPLCYCNCIKCKIL